MTLVLMKVRLRYPLRAGMIGVAMLGGPIILLGAHPVLAPLVVFAFLAGCGTEVFSIGWTTALQENIPNDVLSRVSSYDALGSFVAMPLGQLAFGPLSQVFDESDLMVVSGVVYVMIALGTLASASVRNLQRAPSVVTSTAVGSPAGHASDTVA